LYDNSHSVYSEWDFDSAWQENPGDYPTLI
jgi:hypothetical protein